MGYKPQAGNDDSVVLVQYWPKDKPVPDGWHVVGDFGGSHHSRYSILIKKGEADGGY